MAIRRSDGFVRYVLAIQYHGSSFLGFSYQGKRGEDCITPDGMDLRGRRSVEGRLREALATMVGDDNYENIQVSSRTDQGVHALKNTCHVDIRPRKENANHWDPQTLANGLNYHLVRQPTITTENGGRRIDSSHGLLDTAQLRHTPMQEMRVLGALFAPDKMDNVFFTGEDNGQPPTIDWNARFSATQRTYVYRILHLIGRRNSWGLPFEWDRSWNLPDTKPLDVLAMNEAASLMIGTHDFSSFRGATCQRLSPVVTMNKIDIQAQPFGSSYNGILAGGLPGLELPIEQGNDAALVTISIMGNSFLYRQVRNMVGCFVEVGKGKIRPSDVRQILGECNRSKAPATAPAHGLFLVDVKHGSFVF